MFHCLGVLGSLRSVGKCRKFPSPSQSHSITHSDHSIRWLTAQVCPGNPPEFWPANRQESWPTRCRGQNGMWMCDMCVRLAATTITQVMTPYLNSKIPRQLTWPSKFCQRLAAAACQLCRQFESKLRLDMSGHLAELISHERAQIAVGHGSCGHIIYMSVLPFEKYILKHH